MTRFCKPLVVLMLAMLTALSSWAANWKLNANGSNDAGFTGNTWLSLDDGVTTSTTVNSADDYVVTDGRTIYSGANAKAVFAGHSLTLGDLSTGNSGALSQYYTKSTSSDRNVEVQNEGLFLACGSWSTRYGNATQPYYFVGKVTATAPEANPFRLYRNNTTTGALRFLDAFSGSGWVRVDAASAPQFTLALDGGYDDFTGGIRLDQTATGIGRLEVPAGSCTGTVRTSAGCRIATSALGVTAGFGAFDLAGGTVLEFQAKGTGSTAETRVLTNSKVVLTTRRQEGQALTIQS